jgi:hypothetical protein
LIVQTSKTSFNLKTKGAVRLFSENDAKFLIGANDNNLTTLFINSNSKSQDLQLIVKGDLIVDSPSGYKINALAFAGSSASIVGSQTSEFNGALMKIDGSTSSINFEGRYLFNKEALETLYHNGAPNEWCLVKPEKPSLFERDRTLLGVDSNRNGVRDDVELDILDKYKDEPIWIALSTQDATYLQQTLEVYDDKNKSRALSLADTSMRCFFLVRNTMYGDYDISTMEGYLLDLKVRDRLNWLKDRTMNNAERLKAYWRYNSQLSGMVFHTREPVKEDCKFDIDAYEIEQ